MAMKLIRVSLDDHDRPLVGQIATMGDETLLLDTLRAINEECGNAFVIEVTQPVTLTAVAKEMREIVFGGDEDEEAMRR